MASVASMNGAPRMAPTPTLVRRVGLPLPPAKRIATSGIIVSGSAVPDGRQHAADGALGQVQLVAEPLDAVGEELGRRPG